MDSKLRIRENEKIMDTWSVVVVVFERTSFSLQTRIMMIQCHRKVTYFLHFGKLESTNFFCSFAAERFMMRDMENTVNRLFSSDKDGDPAILIPYSFIAFLDRYKR